MSTAKPWEYATGLFKPKSFRKMLGMDPKKHEEGQASLQMAALTRQQWADYVQMFIPVENELIAYATDPSQVNKAVDKGRENVAQAFEAQEGIQQRQLRSRQQTLTGEEQQAADRQTNLSKSLADVGVANVARDATVARQRGIMMG